MLSFLRVLVCVRTLQEDFSMEWMSRIIALQIKEGFNFVKVKTINSQKLLTHPIQLQYPASDYTSQYVRYVRPSLF